MWEDIFATALADSLWAALFIGLMIYILRDTAKREKKYREMEQENKRVLSQLSDSLRAIHSVKQDTQEIIKNTREIKEETRDIVNNLAVIRNINKTLKRRIKEDESIDSD
jgi:Flp pilus assembly protein TadB